MAGLDINYNMRLSTNRWSETRGPVPRSGLAVLFGVVICIMTPGCDDRPIHAYAALPQVGTQIPEFDFPLVGGGAIRSGDLKGRPTVLALWSVQCGHSLRIRSSLDSLHAANPDVRVIILAANDLATLRQYVDSAGVTVPIAAGHRAVARIFDQSDHAPERDSVRVELAFPSFLVLDDLGVVTARIGGPAMASVFRAVDSLVVGATDSGR